MTVTVRAQRFAAIEAAVSRGLADASSSKQAAERVVQSLAAGMGWPIVEMWLVDDARQVLVCAARSTTRDVRDFCQPELEYGVGLPGAVQASGRPRWIPDLAADATSLRSRLATRYGLRVAVGVPINSGSVTLGALAVYGEHVEDPEDSLTALLAGVAAHTGQYLERRRAEELAIELARTKDEFLAMVTHELRNPLSIITSTAALFDDELDDLSNEQQRQYLHIITRSAERLTVMTGDLLDLARLETGHLGIDPSAIDLAEVIGQAVHAAGTAAASKHLKLTADLDSTMCLYADADRLRQVADNLLSNAIKYTPAGGTVTVTAHLDGDDRIRWTVADTGIGIPAADRPRLFRRFYRASTALQHRIPGTGLGLVVTRAIIERHHGSISVADHDGPGTTFVITLPVKPPA
ncbi:GAF domain-containing sensor histidine kinase [Paractinoplanes rishiriensis]|uniref:GAF domain-containing sensor histidine kinase n=1 Tax=Paractinoplanes rishiriensis TaxID=1050105 RepID=UPI001EF21051|nr:ATP-binding protein [Actinoplanes rishiriensis]